MSTYGGFNIGNVEDILAEFRQRIDDSLERVKALFKDEEDD